MRTHLNLVERDDDLCVAQVPLFGGLTRAEQEQVAELARPTTVAKDELVYFAGSRTAQLMVVHTGRLKISRLSEAGAEQIVRVVGPGDFVGESSFLTGARPDHNATALEAGSMCVFRHNDVARLVARYPSVGLVMLQTVSARLQETEARLASLISGDVSSRLADYLLTLPARRGRGGLAVELPMAKKDIASLLDTTPESFSRQLRRLTDSGVVKSGPGRTLTITDVDALMGLSTH